MSRLSRRLLPLCVLAMITVGLSPAAGAGPSYTWVAGARTGGVVNASAGDTVSLQATLTNTGATADTYRFGLAYSYATWPGTVTSGNAVTLAPGESRLVTAAVSVPAGAGGNDVYLHAAASSETGMGPRITTMVVVPLTMTMTFEPARVLAGDPQVTEICLAYQNGSTAPNLLVQMWDDGPSGVVSQHFSALTKRTGTTQSDGCVEFTRCTGTYLLFDACTPGTHKVCASVVRSGTAADTRCADVEVLANDV